jgi:hypothetical protein
MNRRAALLLACLALLVWPAESRAFSDPDLFGKPPEQGGGGGRYFTASIFDGYGCSVCHRGGAEPKVQVNGLPVDGYQPGVTYNIELSWENPALSHALQLEIVGRDGTVPGQVVLPDPNTVDARGRCGGVPTGKVAAYERMVGTRKVLGVESCKAPSLRFSFTPANVSDLAFSASIMTSDNQGTMEGDGVVTLRRILRRFGDPAPTEDCSISWPHGSASTWSSGALLLVLGLALLRGLRRVRLARAQGRALRR